MKNKLIKLVALSFGFIIFNIIIFSNWAIGIKLLSFLGISIMVISSILFLLGLLYILNKKKNIKDLSNNLSSDKDFIKELTICMSKQEFKEESISALSQIDRLAKKTDMLDMILTQHFSKESLTYQKFNCTILGVKKLFYENLKKMILKIKIFDQDEYNNIAKENKHISTQAALKRNAIYKEYLNYAGIIIEKNEDILIKLDDLILEIAKLEDVEESNIEDLTMIQEVNDLIEQTKYYKQC